MRYARAPSGLAGRARRLWGDIRGQAALSGTFDPMKLIRETLSDETRIALLNALGGECEEVETEKGVRWRLIPEARRFTLAQLESKGRLQSVAEAAAAIATDAFGDYLRRYAIGADELIEKNADLGELHSALQFIQPLVPEAPTPREVEMLLRREEALSAIDFLLPVELVGRGGALRRLDSFVFREEPQADPNVKFFAVSGVGGAGKSALLAKFVRRHHEPDWAGVPTIWLDFDRPLLSSADPVTLMLEFSRQLGLFRPVLAESLSRFRARMREVSPETAEPGTTSEQDQSTLWSIWRTEMGTALPIVEPVVLMLDTFEEVALQGEWQIDRIQRWIDSIRNEGQVDRIRPIISGRALPDAWLKANRNRLFGHIALDDLKDPPARRLLRLMLKRAGARPADFPIRELVDRFGGNALMLGILAKFLAEEGPAAAHDLVSGGESEQLRGEFAQRFLYTRILNRVRADDPDIVKIAYPGLALRRVTADLIEHVLAEPCKLQDVDSNRARELFDKLSRQIWLVRPDPRGDGVLHRRELRRLMIASIPGDKAEAVGEIHRSAMRYYVEGRDGLLSAEDQLIEAVYHSQFTDQPIPAPEPGGSAAFIRALGEDLDDLPEAARARLKLEAGKTLEASEEATLDEMEQADYHDRRTVKSVSAGYSDGPAERERPRLHAEGEAAAAFLELDFDRMFEAEEQIIGEFVELIAGEAGRRREEEQRDLTESAVWRAAMVALASGRGTEFGKHLRYRINEREYDIAWRRPFATRRKSMLTIGQATAMLLTLAGTEIPFLVSESFREIRPFHEIDSIEELRAVTLLHGLGGAPIDSRLHVRMDLLPTLDHEALGEAQSIFKFLPDNLRRLLNSLPKGEGEEIDLADLSRIGREILPVDPASFPYSAIARGITRELHVPIQTAGREVAIDAFLTFAHYKPDRVPGWPAELHSDVLADGLRHDPKRWIATLVEIADRAGMLLELLNEISISSSGDPQIERLQALAKAYDHRLRESAMTASR